ncbi:MAG TPA: class I SAM-dependent methyltransferase [Steroidobacteraceae bacterium]|jgi:SAM-dependent methyltransferase|nr:class I SAM-dependent methyltransferase [Steroidobacteraceae bacterium]
MALTPGARTLCRACDAELTVTFADLGLQPPANAFLHPAADLEQEKRYPLRAKVCCACKLVQVDFDVPPQELFSNYAYFSSYSDDWLAHARRFCAVARERFALNAESLVVELGSNDGYLLKEFVAAGIPVLGIDPSDTVAAAATSRGVATLVDFFGADLAARLAAQGHKADLIIGNNVLAHVPALNDFVAGIAALLKPAGTVTIEFPHLLRLIENAEFDTIYHEHFSYISLYAIERVFSLRGLHIFDVEELPTHGGSLRIYAAHAARGLEDSGALCRVRAAEMRAGLGDLDAYRRFSERVAACRSSLLEFLTRAKAQDKVVAAYGAAAKGNTLLNFCGLTANDIPMVADRNPHKQAKLLPGSHIPVVSPEELRRHKPDYVLILPWNLKTEIMRQLDGIRAWGGRFVTAVPTVHCYE